MSLEYPSHMTTFNKEQHNPHIVEPVTKIAPNMIQRLCDVIGEGSCLEGVDFSIFPDRREIQRIIFHFHYPMPNLHYFVVVIEFEGNVCFLSNNLSLSHWEDPSVLGEYRTLTKYLLSTIAE